MARLEERDYTYLTTVRGMCRTCRALTPARVFIRDGGVWQQSLCPSCENQPALIAQDSEWYLRETLRAFPDRSPLPESRPLREGCPRDCGPCAWHASPCQLPVVSITNACELACPICFTYNRPDRAWYMPLDEMRKTVDWIIASSGRVDLINVTGGEPTLHPQILDILRLCQRPEIGRVTMNSNGLRLAQDEDLCRRLADLGVCVILSFSTFNPEVSQRLHGRDLTAVKLKAIENLTRAGVRMTLLHVMMRDTNEDAAAGIFDLMMANDNILSYTVQTMTYTGQGGGRWPQRAHIPVDEAARIVCRQSKGALEFSDFMPRPSAHPLCYLTCTMLKAGNSLLPFSRFAPREKILSLLKDSYLIRLEDQESFIRETIDSLYARGERKHLRLFRALIEDLFPNNGELTVFDQQKRAEAAVRTVYIHSHMDEDNFDCTRAMLCPDLVPTEPGRLIPACTYNLFYRMKDARFYVEPEEKLQRERQRAAVREYFRSGCKEPFIISHPEKYCVCDVLMPNTFEVMRTGARSLTVQFAQALPFPSLKALIFRALGMKIGKGVFISPGAVVDPFYPWLIELEDDVLLGLGCRILTHEYTAEYFRIGRVRIGKGSVIGAGATVRSGVTIGARVTVGANSFVNKDIPDGQTVGGVPAKPINKKE